eukprot:1348693-Amorphochlora_amoeboformis.AAC.1
MAMEGAIELHRTEINYIGGSNNRKCLDVFTSSKGKLQKVVFGGKSGVVDCFTVKNGNIQQVFKSQSKKVPRFTKYISFTYPLGCEHGYC